MIYLTCMQVHLMRPGLAVLEGQRLQLLLDAVQPQQPRQRRKHLRAPRAAGTLVWSRAVRGSSSPTLIWSMCYLLADEGVHQ